MKTLMELCIKIMNIPFMVEGYKITLWQIFLFTAIGFILFRALFRIFDE